MNKSIDEKKQRAEANHPAGRQRTGNVILREERKKGCQGRNAVKTLVWPSQTQVGILESYTITVQMFSTLHKSGLKMQSQMLDIVNQVYCFIFIFSKVSQSCFIAHSIINTGNTQWVNSPSSKRFLYGHTLFWTQTKQAFTKSPWSFGQMHHSSYGVV